MDPPVGPGPLEHKYLVLSRFGGNMHHSSVGSQHSGDHLHPTRRDRLHARDLGSSQGPGPLDSHPIPSSRGVVSTWEYCIHASIFTRVALRLDELVAQTACLRLWRLSNLLRLSVHPSGIPELQIGPSSKGGGCSDANRRDALSDQLLRTASGPGLRKSAVPRPFNSGPGWGGITLPLSSCKGVNVENWESKAT